MADVSQRSELRSVARPKQARSLETQERLLVAAEQLIEAKGLSDVSVPEIVAQAGSSVGGFYARFRDKDALLRALEERFFQDVQGRLDLLAPPERWAGASIPAIVLPWVTELITTFRRREALIRCFQLRAARDPKSFEDGRRFRLEVSERISALLMVRRGEIRHPDPERAIDLAVQLGFAFMEQASLLGDVRAGGRVLSETEIIDEFTRIFLAYLGIAIDGPGPRA